MNDDELGAAVQRLMDQVDLYLHCELDEEYAHDRPELARRALERLLREELLRASAAGVVRALTQPVTTTPGCDELA